MEHVHAGKTCADHDGIKAASGDREGAGHHVFLQFVRDGMPQDRWMTFPRGPRAETGGRGTPCGATDRYQPASATVNARQILQQAALYLKIENFFGNSKYFT
jgi:hypothetical protein